MKVLDCGSGHHPLPQATHLVDKYPDTDDERRDQAIVIDRPFFNNDITDLPFENNSFDFGNATHVVEHSDMPLKAILEMMRVSKSGYIECPSILAENLFFGSKNHKIVLLAGGGYFTFVKSTRNGRDVPALFWKMVRAGDFLFNLCHTRLYWGNGKAIRLRFNLDNTSSIPKKIHHILTFSIGDIFQSFMNQIAMLIRGDVKIIYKVIT